ncbi:MAG: hypothetical protein PHR51_01345 [Patescibacteria group bacterium]|nr:hypothetical protein [Patescibacteria group bacterium]
MTGLIITYIILALMAATYVGINIFHVFRFRIKDPADKSLIVLFIYLALVVTIAGFSLIAGIVAYNV